MGLTVLALFSRHAAASSRNANSEHFNVGKRAVAGIRDSGQMVLCRRLPTVCHTPPCPRRSATSRLLRAVPSGAATRSQPDTVGLWLFSHPACENHWPGSDTSEGHPECPARVTSILADILSSGVPIARHVQDAPTVTREQLLRFHTAEHVDSLEELFRQIATGDKDGLIDIDGDTQISKGTEEAAKRAAGAACAAVDAVVSGNASTAFCVVRPPGHHAEPNGVMGFCFYANVAVAALHARAQHGIQRVAVVDFDVHHGNGSQAGMQHDPDFFFASSHQY